MENQNSLPVKTLLNLPIDGVIENREQLYTILEKVYGSCAKGIKPIDVRDATERAIDYWAD